MSNNISKERNKLERVHVGLRKKAQAERAAVDKLTLEAYMSEGGTKADERARKISAAEGYLAVAIECLFQAEQIDL